MIDLTVVQHHPVIQDLTDLLCRKTQNKDRSFFQVEVAYFISKVAACMRANVLTKDRGEVPINTYALALATSGYGKGHSVGIVENQILNGFKQRFTQETMPLIAEQNLARMASENAVKQGVDEATELDRLEAAYKRCGAYPFTFDSGTAPAVKQLRQRLLMANSGSINLQIDEIGSNLIANTEVLNVFLELFDQGYTKNKVTKNTNDNIRGDDLDGKTPANMLLFGTPVKLFDGGVTENEFYSFLETGFARRCLFGYGRATHDETLDMTPEQIFQQLTDTNNDVIVDRWNQRFTELADPLFYDWQIEVPDDVAIELIGYQKDCKEIASNLNEYDEIQKAELSHRYFKALKLAGAFAFLDKVKILTMTHLQQAIKLVEESGSAFQKILAREKTYMKLAKFIAGSSDELTHADLTEALPFYKSSQSYRNEQMSLAIAWGYKHHILIKKHYVDNIEFFTGDMLQQTNLDNLICSYSYQFGDGYTNDKGQFEDFDKMCLEANLNFCNHHFTEGKRRETHVIPGFNMIVLDVDGGASLSMAKDLFRDYSYVMYTTKRHTPEENRFRIILPIEYELKLDTEEYRTFMNNIMKWLPFEVDESCNQRAKKWAANANGQYFINEGQLLDPLPFVPETSKNDKFLQEYQKIESLDNLERWFMNRIQEGSRNNTLLRFAMVLVDDGIPQAEVIQRVSAFNQQIPLPLSDDELASTIFKTVASKCAARDGAKEIA